MSASDPGVSDVIEGGAFDHVILATLDAEAAVARLRRDHGLGAFRGGSHPWGTANWIVPLQPPTYLEILFPADPDRLIDDPEGNELLERMRRGEFWAGWALRPASIEDVARRLELELERGQATRPDGSVSSWRTAAPRTDLDGSLPFFIDYDDPTDRLERFAASYAAARHERRVGSVAWIEIGLDPGDAGQASFLGRLTADVEIRTVEGASPGVRAVGLRVDDQVIKLEAGQLEDSGLPPFEGAQHDSPSG
jgi:hypothetical protein